MKSRRQQVDGAVDFLVTQVNDARKELEAKDESLRRYKEERMGRLPEQLQTNLATMGMLQQELRTVEESLLFARERQEALARGARPAARRPRSSGHAERDGHHRAARQLASMRGRYTDEHPDVQSLEARIAGSKARMSPTGRLRTRPVEPSRPRAARTRPTSSSRASSEGAPISRAASPRCGPASRRRRARSRSSPT